MNINNMSIFNKGVIINELCDGRMWEVEIVRSTPIKPGCIVSEEKQQQGQNFVNYSFERNLFYSPPGELFETFSYRYVFFY